MTAMASPDAACRQVPVIRLTLTFRFCRWLVWLINRVFFRARWYCVERVPTQGGLLLVANHQSYLDSPLIGCAIRQRRLAYLARAGLFRFRPLGWLLSTFHCVPISEQGGDVAAMRTVIALLQAGNAVLIFPEGSRTPTGAMMDFKRGVGLVLRKARCPVVPVAVEGAYRAWPRHRRLPVLFRHRIGAIYGHPIPYEDLMAGGADAALDRLQAEVAALRCQLCSLLGMPVPEDGSSSHA
ncbi:MAG: lysophospholipid acyltransferase family protein [Phycisphaerales bacterium]